MRLSDELCRRSKLLRKIRSMSRKKVANKVTKRAPQIISKEEYLEEKRKARENDKDYINSLEVTKVEGEPDIIEIEIQPRKIVCPDCGGITMEGLEFCHKCGGEIDVNM